MTAIDVGQGDSILLVSPTGRTLLVDAGGLPQWVHSDLDIGEDVVSPYLWSRAISRLDAVAITHAHADHMGGAAAILANFRPRELWLGDPSDPEMKALLLAGAGTGGARRLATRPAMSSILAGRRCESWLPAPRTWLRGAMMNLW